MPPGHTPVSSPNTEWVEFTHADDSSQRTRGVMERNIAAIEQQSYVC
jgi:hypothetical protein